MAIIRNRKAATSTSSVANEAWKASAFLNLYLTGKTNVRLGAIALRESNASEAKILAWIAGDSAKAASLKDKFILSYNTVTDSTGLDFLADIEVVSHTPEEVGAIGYVNISLPTATGSARLGSIVLKDGNVLHEKLDVWLADVANLNVLKDSMTIVYQSAVSKSVEFLLD